MSRKLANHNKEQNLWNIFQGAKFRFLDHFRARTDRVPNADEYSAIYALAAIVASFSAPDLRGLHAQEN